MSWKFRYRRIMPQYYKGHIRSQIQTNWCNVYITYQSRCWPSATPCISQSLAITGHDWHTLIPTLNFQSRGWAALPQMHSLYNSATLVTDPFLSTLVVSLLAQTAQELLSLLHPLPLHGLLRSCPICTFPDIPASGCTCLFIYNKASSPLHIGTATPFPFYFFPSFICGKPTTNIMSSKAKLKSFAFNSETRVVIVSFLIQYHLRSFR